MWGTDRQRQVQVPYELEYTLFDVIQLLPYVGAAPFHEGCAVGATANYLTRMRTRGKAIGFVCLSVVVIVVTTKIVRSGDIGV